MNGENEIMSNDQDKRDENIGKAILSLSWVIFAAKFIIIATVIAGIAIYLLGQPLWEAPLIAIGLFIIYRLIWRLVWVFIEWSGKQ